MILKIRLISAAFLLCLLIENVVGSAKNSKFTAEEKANLIKSLLEMKQNVPIHHLLSRLVNYRASLELTTIRPVDPHIWAKEVLDLLRTKESNPFHNIVSGDDVFGGRRDHLEMLLEIVDNLKYDEMYHANATNKKNNEASSDRDKSMDKKDCDMKKTVQNIRYIAKKYIDTHEIENKYWKNGLISKQLELISEGFNHASTPSIITESIEDFLSKILTRDQFVIIVTNLCLQHSFSDVNIKKMGVYTVVVMRSTLFKRKPFQWLQMEQDVSSMNLMFNCNEKFYKQNDQYSFVRGIKGVHATSAAMFCNCDAYRDDRVQTSVVNVNKAVSKGTPGWWITGNEYANYFKSDQLKTLVMNSVKNSILVLCF